MHIVGGNQLFAWGHDVVKTYLICDLYQTCQEVQYCLYTGKVFYHCTLVSLHLKYDQGLQVLLRWENNNVKDEPWSS